MKSDALVYHNAFNKDRIVHIVDSDLPTCEAVSLLFRLEGFQTAFYNSAVEFLAVIEQRRVDVVVLNLQLSDGNGLALLRRIKTMHAGKPVFMLSDQAAVDAAVTAMKFGASDVITKPIDSEHLLTSVRDALRKDVHIGAMQEGRRAVEVRGFSALTKREREVLQLIAEGRSNKQTGVELRISPRTVEVHRSRVMEKLGARNATDLMRIVLTS